MSLSDRITQVVEHVDCRTCAFYDALPPGDKTEFDKWITDNRPVEVLRRMCVEEGLSVSEKPFRRHVRDHHGQR